MITNNNDTHRFSSLHSFLSRIAYRRLTYSIYTRVLYPLQYKYHSESPYQSRDTIELDHRASHNAQL
jgi:hypothetical protein